MKKTVPVWLDYALIANPIRYMLCLDESAYKKVRGELGIDVKAGGPFLISDSGATTHFYSCGNDAVAIVCMDREESKRSGGIEIAMLLVHEAVHIWQEAMALLREEDPGVEIEAYSIQTIGQNLCVEYQRQMSGV